MQGECEPCSNNGRVGARGHCALASLDLDLHRNKHASKGCSPNLDTSCDSNISSVARATAKRDREREGRRPRNEHPCPVKTGGLAQHPSTTETGRPSSKTSPCATGARPDAQPKQTTSSSLTEAAATNPTTWCQHASDATRLEARTTRQRSSEHAVALGKASNSRRNETRNANRFWIRNAK